MKDGKLKIKQIESISLNNIVLNGGITDNNIKFINNNSGPILTSPDSMRWRITINTDGQLITTPVNNPISYSPLVWLSGDNMEYDSSSLEISKWTDQSGNNNHGYQSGTGSTTYGATAFNGHPSVIFDGSNNKYMNVNVGVTVSECTYFLVYEDISTVITGSTIISDGDNPSNLHDKRLYKISSITYLRNGGDSLSPSFADSTLNILSIKWTYGATVSYRHNNGSWIDVSVESGSDTTSFNLGNWAGAGTGSGDRPIEMNLSQVIIYDYIISDEIGDLIFTYLNDLYNVY